ncbi:glycosyltransferase [Allorhizobium sp. BGMRC 0089]|uniref:glycosyltransferase n=1 Tax=Allorhizobium sonneratiae TaxID=2934936 RepID=UPI002034A1D1|nr:glycosyltransferase [Allorhizobium sonneratiae]MCM2293286.1 glycosyltransferase [Allorhizobium sonneratiae]
MRVALVHYWLLGMRGGEKVLEALCELFPQADIYTHVYDKTSVSPVIKRHKVTTSFIDRLPYSRKYYQKYLPLMPMALEHLDLGDYDLVISSESGPAKGIIPNSSAVHICYCHSPMRYLWNMYRQYHDGTSGLTRLMMPPLAHYLRTWDVTTAQRVDAFAANSHTVAARIRRYYRRPSTIIHPPVDTVGFQPVPSSEIGDYYLMAGELVAYKRPDIAIEAFNRMKAKLVVIGKGEELRRLTALAGPTVTLMGAQPFEVLKHHYARCKALIFPGEEDFGIVPVEAMASGRPVIAFGRGGATETVVHDKTGLFFDEQSVECLIDAVEAFERWSFNPADALQRASLFAAGQFKQNFSALVDSVMQGEPHVYDHAGGPVTGQDAGHACKIQASSGVEPWPDPLSLMH